MVGPQSRATRKQLPFHWLLSVSRDGRDSNPLFPQRAPFAKSKMLIATSRMATRPDFQAFVLTRPGFVPTRLCEQKAHTQPPCNQCMSRRLYGICSSMFLTRFPSCLNMWLSLTQNIARYLTQVSPYTTREYIFEHWLNKSVIYETKLRNLQSSES